MKAWDFIFNKLIPKKFVVFLIATVALFMKLIDGQSWMIVSVLYIGGNTVAKFVNIKGKK